MTVTARRIIAEPVRSASDTWKVIVDLLAPEADNPGRRELVAVLGIASSLIASEAVKDAPIVVFGSGPRIRVYCLYGEDAIVGEDASESPLPTTPINGDWNISLPCPEDELEWVKTALKKHSSRITARELNSPVEDDEGKSTNSKGSSVNLEAFLRP